MSYESPVPKGLKALREKAGLSIRELAEGLEISPSSYNHYETRFKKPYLPLDLAQSIALILLPHGVRPSEVLALSGYDKELDMAGDEVDEIGPWPPGFAETGHLPEKVKPQPKIDVSSIPDLADTPKNTPEDAPNTIKIAIVGNQAQVAATVDVTGLDELIRRLTLTKEMIAL